MRLSMLLLLLGAIGGGSLVAGAAGIDPEPSDVGSSGGSPQNPPEKS